MRLFVTLLFFIYSLPFNRALSQDSIANNETDILEYLSQWAEQSGEEMDLDEINEYLLTLQSNPVKVNSAKDQELRRIFWLNDYQISNILKYLKSAGNIQTIYELKNIAGLSENDARMLINYISFEVEQQQLELRTHLENFNQKLILRTQKTIEEQAGYKPDQYSGKPTFTGNNVKFYSRYAISNKYISAGFTGEKDAGEEFLSGSNRNGFDFYSFHVQISNLKYIKTIALGDYKVNFGSGLLTGSAFGLGKNPAFLSNIYQTQGISKFTSTDENAFLRGAGVTLQHGKKELSLFYSGHPVDANITLRDTVSNEIKEVSSLQTTGIHSIYSEIADEDAIKSRIFGGHFAFRTTYAEIGLTGVINNFSATINPTLEPYNTGYFRGKQNTNLGIDYRFRMQKILWFGEGAVSKSGRLAILSGLQAFVTSGITLNAIYRNYANNFQSLQGNAFGENSRNQNENGLYMGMQCQLMKYVSFSGYADFFSFPRARYNVDFPSDGHEYMGQLTYSPNYFFTMNVQFRTKEKGVNETIEALKKNILVTSQSQQIRLGLTYKVNQSIVLKNRLNYVKFTNGSNLAKEGYFISQDVDYSFCKIPLKLYTRYALFNTDGYDTRVYSYENDLLYTFSIPAFYDKGSRFYLMVKASPGEVVDLWIKYSITSYNNKEIISSGLYEIQGNQKSELKVQAIFKF